MKVKIGELADFCKFVGISICHIPEESIEAESNALIEGNEYYEVPDNIYERIRESALKERKRDSEYQEISTHRIAGMEREAEDDIDAAIIEYAESIRLGESAENDMYHAFAHSYSRIIILLDKVKRYAEEIDYIVALLNRSVSDSDRNKYSARLVKTKEKLKKQCERGSI